MNKRYKIFELKNYGDERSNMCVLEAERESPFEIKRLFYDYSTKNSLPRGNHANRYSKFAFICLSGSCKVDVDDGKHKETFSLESPNKMLVIESMVWKVMYNFTQDSVLLVISDRVYDKSEYIRNYDDYIYTLNTEGIHDGSEDVEKAEERGRYGFG